MAWEENKHPRDKSGQFTSKGNEGSGGKLEFKDEKKKRISKYMNEDGTASFSLDNDPRSKSLLRNALGKDGVFLLKEEDGLYTVAPGADTTNEQFENWLLENTGSEYKNKEELLGENDFDSDNDFDNWGSQAISVAEEELGINALDSNENYDKVCDWLMDNGYAEDFDEADKMIKDSLNQEGWDKLNKIRDEWGIDDVDDFDSDELIADEIEPDKKEQKQIKKETKQRKDRENSLDETTKKVESLISEGKGKEFLDVLNGLSEEDAFEVLKRIKGKNK